MIKHKYMVNLEVMVDEAEYAGIFGIEQEDVLEDLRVAIAENAHEYLASVGCTGVQILIVKKV